MESIKTARTTGRVAARKERQFTSTTSWRASPEYTAGFKHSRRRFRTVLGVPMLGEEPGEVGSFLAPRVQEVRPFSRQADRAACRQFRQSGRDRHRESRLFDEVQAKTRDSRIAAAADRDRRRAQDHQPLVRRSRDGSRHSGGDGGAPLPRRPGVDVPPAR